MFIWGVSLLLLYKLQNSNTLLMKQTGRSALEDVTSIPHRGTPAFDLPKKIL